MRAMLFALLVVGLTAAAGAQVGAPKLNFLADSVQPDGNVVRLQGHVRIAACSVVTADEGVLDLHNYEATVSGNVRMKLTNGVDTLTRR